MVQIINKNRWLVIITRYLFLMSTSILLTTLIIIFKNIIVNVIYLYNIMKDN